MADTKSRLEFKQKVNPDVVRKLKKPWYGQIGLNEKVFNELTRRRLILESRMAFKLSWNEYFAITFRENPIPGVKA